MRRCICAVAVGFTLAVGLCVCAAEEAGDTPPREPFVLDWWTMDGGGGPTVGGGFELLASIGQPDVGVAIGEDYLLQGGFLAGGDLGILFVDGFESGTTGRWGGTTEGVVW